MKLIIGHQNTTPPVCTQSLPRTVSVAEVFSCPHTHEYSPASATVRPRISSSHVAPSCLRITLSPALRVSEPFLHSTGAALLSSQCSVAEAPSVASSFLRPLVNLAGRAGDRQKHTNTIMLSDHREETGCRQHREDTKPNWTWATCCVCQAHEVGYDFNMPNLFLRHRTDSEQTETLK